ncbi:mechanosensitive ion channel family protein [Phaeobacter sp. HF9A]|uniref:mechanosensitive ion channel family protein n=1 Tax=Phaeobacter sp. HF9A TaxID=2721561 RepID=UPI0014314620|nr:mechanosensitive ion channel domain-containing protein [Phaeobacter sp. HF9A]NIZ15250.1 mechanosensitive ion channel family protein [Phaeobacter sp. HF9A]
MRHLRMILRLWGAVLALSLCLFGGPAAMAQEAESADATALAEAIRQASEAGIGVVILDARGQPIGMAPAASEDARREAAAGQEARQEAAMMGGSSTLMKAQSELHNFGAKLDERLQALPNSMIEMTYILRATSPDGRIVTYVWVVGITTLLLLVGRWLSIEIYGKRLIRRFVARRIEEAPEGYAGKMPFLLIRFFAGLGATIFAMLFAMAITLLVFGPSNDVSVQFTSFAVYLTFFAARTASDLWRMVLSPYLSQYRIPALEDREARRLYLWLSVLATFDIAAVMVSTWVQDFGLNYNIYALTYAILMLVSSALAILLVLVNAPAVSRAIRRAGASGRTSWLNRLLSWIWVPLVICYIAVGWLALAFDMVLARPGSVPPIMGLFAVLSAILVVYGLINYAIEQFAGRRARIVTVPRDVDDTAAEDVRPARPPHPLATYKDLARRAAGILAFAGGAVALVHVWDPGFRMRPDSVTDRGVDVLVILFIGYLVYHLARIWIDSKIEEESEDLEEGELGDEGGGNSASRLATLLPLFRGAILAVVVVSIALIILLEMGINVSPLFAGAGVVGLAVGFGSQTLVRDIFSGAFFLLDDAFRRGEYIDIGSVKGPVEKISGRSFQLRHHLGALHTIPFGEIQVLTNYSRDWVIMKLPLRVTYDTDVEKVRKLIKKLGQDLLEDEVIGHDFIQPLKSQGVIEMQDSAMIIRVKFMTKPGDQWLIRKRVFQEIRDLFLREGIKFAHREVTVRVVDEQGAPVSGNAQQAALGAAQAVIEDEEADANEGGDDR